MRVSIITRRSYKRLKVYQQDRVAAVGRCSSILDLRAGIRNPRNWIFALWLCPRCMSDKSVALHVKQRTHPCWSYRSRGAAVERYLNASISSQCAFLVKFLLSACSVHHYRLPSLSHVRRDVSSQVISAPAQDDHQPPPLNYTGYRYLSSAYLNSLGLPYTLYSTSNCLLTPWAENVYVLLFPQILKTPSSKHDIRILRSIEAKAHQS